MKRVFIDMDGTLAEWRQAADFEDLYEENYFLSLRPHEDAVKGAVDLIKGGIEVIVLSAYLPDSKYALREKREWAQKYLGENIKCIFVPYGESKAEWIETVTGQAICTDDFLVDDHSPNLFDWTSHKGTALKFMNGINGEKGTWKGPKVSGNFANSIL